MNTLLEKRKSATANRTMQSKKTAAIERKLDNCFSSSAGLLSLAGSLSNVVRRQLDYRGITRNFSVVDILPMGMPAVFDRDVQFLGAPAVGNAQVGANGAVREIYMNSDRIMLGDGFEIGVVPQIPWRQTFIRRYDVVKRVGDKLRQGIQQREDLLWLSYLNTAEGLYTGTERKHQDGNITLNIAGKLSKSALADAFAQIDDRRLPVRFVLGDAYMRASMQSWTFQDLDQAGMQELREVGYLGNMFGADFFYSDQLSFAAETVSGGSGYEQNLKNRGVCYVLTDPQFLSWTPLRCDLQVQPADKPWEFTLGFAGYELLNMCITNNWGVVKITYDKEVY